MHLVFVHNPGAGRPSGSSNGPIETIPSWPIHKTAQGDGKGKLMRRRPPTRSGGADRSSRSSVQPANANGPPPLVVLPADFSGLRTHESAEESTSSVSCYFTTHIFPLHSSVFVFRKCYAWQAYITSKIYRNIVLNQHVHLILMKFLFFLTKDRTLKMHAFPHSIDE